MNLDSFNHSFYEALPVDVPIAGASERVLVERCRYIDSLLGGAKKILDVGSGDGVLAMRLSEGRDVVGVDLCSRLVARSRSAAKAQGRKVRFLRADMRSLPFSDGSFDAIYSVGATFNHLLKFKDQVSCLRELCRVCAVGGRIIIDLGNWKRPSSYVKYTRNTPHGSVVVLPIEGGEHVLSLVHHTQKSMKSVLSAANLVEARYDYTFYRRRFLIIDL